MESRPCLQQRQDVGVKDMLGLSLLHAPWTLTSKALQVLKNMSFENFKNVASGRFAANLDDAAEFLQKMPDCPKKRLPLLKKQARN